MDLASIMIVITHNLWMVGYSFPPNGVNRWELIFFSNKILKTKSKQRTKQSMTLERFVELTTHKPEFWRLMCKHLFLNRNRLCTSRRVSHWNVDSRALYTWLTLILFSRQTTLLYDFFPTILRHIIVGVLFFFFPVLTPLFDNSMR